MTNEIDKEANQKDKVKLELENVYAKMIWNAAIEKAAELAVSDYHITKEEILKLKV